MLDFISIRRDFHKHPELSGKEMQTSGKIAGYLKQLGITSIVRNVGGNGLIAIIEGEAPGLNLMFRADIDAIAVYEKNDFEYCSSNEGVAHTCGHDGHTTIALRFIEKLLKHKVKKGKVFILFQPEEETGEGSAKVLQHPFFKENRIDFVFGLHNIPGFPTHQIIFRESTFAAASVGMHLEMEGKYAHAAEPEKGNNPAFAFPELIEAIKSFSNPALYKEMVRLTITHIKLGEHAFGISPGKAKFLCTLRANLNEDLEKMKELVKLELIKIEKKHQLKITSSWHEPFNATINHPEANNIVLQAFKEYNLPIVHKEEAFRWSEDFAEYLLKYKGTFFGLGSGINTPDLHNEHYDFPDELIESGSNAFMAIYEQFEKKEI